MSSSPSTSALRVMLVDDHPVVRSGYRRLLELEQDVCVVAEHGDVDAALASLCAPEAMLPEVVVVDLAMPRRSGLELVREVRERQLAVRVLIFSMHDNSAVVGEALRLGAAGFVTKSSAPEELVRCLRCVRHHRGPVLSSDLVVRRLQGGIVEDEPLTLKELEVLRRLALGEAVSVIAETMKLSPKTVSNYQTNLKHKLGASTAIELMRYARERGYVA
jgi:two-component system, NarL family, response regulator FusR